VSASSLAIEIDKVVRGSRQTLSDEVAVEEPLEIQVCAASDDSAAARSISITMRTPGHDSDLALGFLFTEGLIHDIDDVRSAVPAGPPDEETGFRNVVRVELDPAVSIDTDKLTRHFYTTSSCGVCGKASLDALRVSVPAFERRDFSLSRDALTALPDRLRERQRLFDTTGGLHAAAAFNRDGGLVVVREDVGRHNAVDKVVGALLAGGRLPADDLGLVVSGRASFELMQKTLVAGMPMLAAVSAPSSLAVRLAREFGLTLVGFLRDQSFNIYSAAERIRD
jgi:FdhD protein